MPMLENIREETFAQRLATGLTQSDAYRAAFPRATKWKSNTVRTRAWALAKRDDIKERVAELVAEAAERAVMQRQERMETLTTIARNDKKGDRWRIQAIEVLNKMDGVYSAGAEDTAGARQVVIINDTRRDAEDDPDQ